MYIEPLKNPEATNVTTPDPQEVKKVLPDFNIILGHIFSIDSAIGRVLSEALDDLDEIIDKESNVENLQVTLARVLIALKATKALFSPHNTSLTITYYSLVERLETLTKG